MTHAYRKRVSYLILLHHFSYYFLYYNACIIFEYCDHPAAVLNALTIVGLTHIASKGQPLNAPEPSVGTISECSISKFFNDVHPEKALSPID